MDGAAYERSESPEKVQTAEPTDEIWRKDAGYINAKQFLAAHRWVIRQSFEPFRCWNEWSRISMAALPNQLAPNPLVWSFSIFSTVWCPWCRCHGLWRATIWIFCNVQTKNVSQERISSIAWLSFKVAFRYYGCIAGLSWLIPVKKRCHDAILDLPPVSGYSAEWCRRRVWTFAMCRRAASRGQEFDLERRAGDAGDQARVTRQTLWAFMNYMRWNYKSHAYIHIHRYLFIHDYLYLY